MENEEPSEPPKAPGFDYRALAEVLATHPDLETGCGDEVSLAPGQALRYFGDYLLEEEIARGGMGVVYRARQLTLDRTVAVKVLRDSVLAGGTEVDRFRREATSAAALRHRNIVGIHEIGEHEGVCFFSMDFMPGPTLGTLLADGPLAAMQAAGILGKLASAIQHAHEAGVLHRDIKPSNVIMDGTGEPMLMDFGLAKHDASDAGLTFSGQVLGTPAYMAPEQAHGQAKSAGSALDIYGLGALLYHMVTGRPPFAGESHLAVLKQVLNDEPVSAALLNPSLPRDIETICAKAMSRDAVRRYASAKEMADDLQRFLEGRPVLARPVSPAGKLWRWSLRHRALSAALVLAFMALAGLAAVLTVSNQRLSAQGEILRDKAYAAEMAQAAQEISAHHLRHARELLARQRPSAGARDLRGLDWEILAGAVKGQQHAVIGTGQGLVRSIAITRDGTRLAVAAEGGRITLWDFAIRSALASVQHGKLAPTLTFSPDEQELLTGGDDGLIRRWRADTLTEIPSAWEQSGRMLKLAFSPDGTRLLGAAQTGLSIWQTTEPGQAPVRQEYGAWFSASFSPDATRLVLPSVNGPVSVRDVESGSESAELRLGPDQSISSAFSPTGDLLSLGYFGGEVNVWSFAEGGLAATLPAHVGVCYTQAFSPDGQWLATGGNDGLLKIWSTKTWTLASVSRGHIDGVSVVVWLDNDRLLTGGRDGMLALWDRLSSDGSGWTPFAAPLGTSLFHRDGDVWLFDSASEAAINTGTRETFPVQAIARSAAGTPLRAQPTSGGHLCVKFPNNRHELLQWDGRSSLGYFPNDGSLIGAFMVSRGGRHVCAPITQDGAKKLAVGRLGERDWDYVAGDPVAALVPYGFSPDGLWLSLVSTHGAFSLYNTAERRISVTIEDAHRGLPLGVSFTPDGQECASCGGDGAVRIWECATLKLLRTLREAPAFTCVAYSPDGLHLASGTPDGAVLLWNVDSNRDATVLRLPAPDYVLGIAWSDDGRSLVATSRQGYMRWEAANDWD